MLFGGGDGWLYSFDARGDMGGNYYALEDPPMEGWLCPALFQYYEEPPPPTHTSTSSGWRVLDPRAVQSGERCWTRRFASSTSAFTPRSWARARSPSR